MTQITDWSQLPLMVPHETVAHLFGRSKRSIQRLVRLGTMKPMPILTRPMVWSRADLEAHWRGTSAGAGKIRRVS